MSKVPQSGSALASPRSSTSTRNGQLAALRADLEQLSLTALAKLRERIAAGDLAVPDDEAEVLERCWPLVARPSQREPDGDWFGWLMMAGRGWGKTRTGAEWIARKARDQPGVRCALVAPTFADGRDTMVEGESGLLSVLAPQDLRGGRQDTAWNRSIGELFLANGSRFRLFSSEKPNRLRGPQHHYAWFEEPAVWEDAHKGDVVDTTWSNAMLGLRLGEDPRWVATSTPKAVRLFVGTREKPGIARRGNIVVTSGSTYENLANLARTFRDTVIAGYEGTRLAAQELHGQLLEEIEGALWWDAIIGRLAAPVELTRIVVGVDPQAGDDEDAAETGIVVAGFDTHTQLGHVLDDRTVRGSPHEWASAAVQAYRDWRADRIVVERNNGGAMVEHTIRTVDANVPVKTVWASHGKRTRAEPVAALYEQSRVHHARFFPELEEQMCLAAGTLVRTRRGEIPIERVRIGDQALTRFGWRSVTWAGLTGFAHCMEIATVSGRRLRCTPGHPVWIEGVGFRPAREVQLHECLSRSLESTSSIEGSSTSESASHQARSTGALRGLRRTAASRCSCIECSTRRRTGRSLRAATSIIAMAMGSTTISAIWRRLLVPPIIWRTGLAVLPCSMLRPAALRRAPSGPNANRGPLSVSNATRSSSARGCAPCSAADPVVAVTTPESAATEPVYNLTVAGQPEFFANGLLVHNCTWVPDTGMDSPDRMDALVWALTELMVDKTGGQQYASYDDGAEPVVVRGDLVLRGAKYVDRK